MAQGEAPEGECHDDPAGDDEQRGDEVGAGLGLAGDGGRGPTSRRSGRGAARLGRELPEEDLIAIVGEGGFDLPPEDVETRLAPYLPEAEDLDEG